MVETGVDEVERGDGDVPGVGDVVVRGFASADAVGGPETLAGVVKGDVAFAFEGCFARRFPKDETMTGEPAAEIAAFRAAFGVREARDGGDTVVNQTSVAHECHVGAAGFGMQKADVGDAAEDVVDSLPLREGKIT